jgi:NADH dehydrogenase
MHQIVIVGGGAGGLELATRLGDTLGKRGLAEITLVEKSRTHFWKPHLHELAAGSVDLDVHELDYLAQAHWHHFRYRLGEMVGLDRENKLVHLAPWHDEDGIIVTEARSFPYDTLVIAVGSLTNDFGTPGAAENAIFLENVAEADRFHRRLVNAFLRAHSQSTPLRPEQLQVVIVGAGATGVELSAELHNAVRDLVSYNLDRIDPDKDIRIHLIEASPRILPALPERISMKAQKLLQDLRVEVHTYARVAEVLPAGVRLADGQEIPAELVVWAAGVKAPAFLSELGLETNAIHQLMVQPTLQTTRDPDIFAIGDCASSPWLGQEGRTVPPRAQAAHQQSNHLIKMIPRKMKGLPLTAFQYRDFGSLVSLGEYSTVGSLMGNFVRGNMWVEGGFARLMYVSLYKMHQMALHGFWKMALSTLSRFISRRTEPHVKLH